MLNNNIKIDLHIHSKASAYKETDGYVDEGNSSNYLNEIKLGDKSYELSTGINAIIGENGAGKSYILGKLNEEEDRKYKKINDIYTKLYNEYNSNSNFYTGEKEITINKILTALQDLRKLIAKERDEIIQKNKVINVVIGVFNDFNTKIKADRTSQENENEDMITEIRDFSLKIKSYLINKDKEIEFPNFPKTIHKKSTVMVDFFVV